MCETCANDTDLSRFVNLSVHKICLPDLVLKHGDECEISLAQYDNNGDSAK